MSGKIRAAMQGAIKSYGSMARRAREAPEQPGRAREEDEAASLRRRLRLLPGDSLFQALGSDQRSTLG